jgi:Tol biopolymer transport system component
MKNYFKLAYLVLGLLVVACSIKKPHQKAIVEGLTLRTDKTITIETTEGTCMNLDMSPDGKTLVFDLLGNIFTLPIQGGEATQLTKGISWDKRPVWSPDGEKIAYISDGTGSNKIWLTDKKGNNRHAVSGAQFDSNIHFGNGGVEWHKSGKFLIADKKLFSLNGLVEQQNPLYFKDSLYKLVSKKKGLLYNSISISPDQNWMTYLTIVNQKKTMRPGDNTLHTRNLKTEKNVLEIPIDKLRKGYERHTFSIDSKSVFLGYGGKIHRINILSGEDVIIPFSAKVKVDVGHYIYNKHNVNNETLNVKYIRNTHVAPNGEKMVFSALSTLYTMDLPNGKPYHLIKQNTGQFYPKYSPDGKSIAYITSNKGIDGHIWIVSEDGGKVKKITKEAGYYKNLEWSPDGTYIVVLNGAYKNENDLIKYSNTQKHHKGNLLRVSIKGEQTEILANNIPIDNKLSFIKNKEGEYSVCYWVAPDFNKGIYSKEITALNLNTRNTRTIAKLSREVEKVSLSPTGDYIVYQIGNDIYLTTIRNSGQLGHNPKWKIMRLTPLTGGHSVNWSNDGNKLRWQSGANLLEISTNSGAEIITKLYTHNSYKPFNLVDTIANINLKTKRKLGSGILALKGAKIITMENQIIENGVVIIKNDRIQEVGPLEKIKIPKTAKVINLMGKTIVPGFIDMHAHNLNSKKIVLKNYWNFKENLNFGVTTNRDPSVQDDDFGNSELIETGDVIGPRLFGAVALSTDQTYKIDNLDDARIIARTYKALGANFLKVHDAWSRKQRQYIAIAARELNMNLTGHASGGHNGVGQFDLSHLLDGFTGIEHALPVGKLYDDVQQLFSKTGIWFTPTLINSSAYFGKLQVKYASSLNFPPFKVKKKHLNGQLENKAFINEDFPEGYPGLYNAQNLAEFHKKGAIITAGSHGDYPGIQLHWEIWLFNKGGLTPYEALQTATINAAKGLGMQNDLGSISKGKIADLLILDKDPLVDIKNTLSINAVMKNGILYEPKTLKVLAGEN